MRLRHTLVIAPRPAPGSASPLSLASRGAGAGGHGRSTLSAAARRCRRRRRRCSSCSSRLARPASARPGVARPRSRVRAVRTRAACTGRGRLGGSVPLPPGESRCRAGGSVDVVFLGDSITENWLLSDPAFFTGGFVNRGIGAQTSAQMLVRFRADVVALHPKVVHILAGTNDVAGNNGPIAPDDFHRNIESMVELARANGVRVVLGSIPPASAFAWRPAMRPAPRIVELNRWLRDYAKQNATGLRRLSRRARERRRRTRRRSWATTACIPTAMATRSCAGSPKRRCHRVRGSPPGPRRSSSRSPARAALARHDSGSTRRPDRPHDRARDGRGGARCACRCRTRSASSP